MKNERARMGQTVSNPPSVPVALPKGADSESFTITDEAYVGEGSAINSEFLDGLDQEADNLAGYLFPDTYFFTRSMDEGTLLRTMVDEFRQRWTQERQQRARELKLTTREVVTLALTAAFTFGINSDLKAPRPS